jgi:PAS domain-containing protein
VIPDARISIVEMEDKLRESEKAVLRAREEWKRTFDSIPDLIALLDKEHRVVRVNRAMANRLGLTPDNCIGARCHEVVHGLPRPPDFCPHTLTCRDGGEHMTEVHEAVLGGDFLVSTTPLPEAADHPQRVMTSFCSARGTYHLMKFQPIPRGATSTPRKRAWMIGSASGTYRNR